ALGGAALAQAAGPADHRGGGLGGGAVAAAAPGRGPRPARPGPAGGVGAARLGGPPGAGRPAPGMVPREQRNARRAGPRLAAEPGAGHVPASWVAWLSRWRLGREEPGWTVREFFLALARRGGHQNRKGDGPPGWQVLWKGWTKLHTVLEFASARDKPNSG